LKQFAKMRLQLTAKLFQIYNMEVFNNKVSDNILMHFVIILSG